MKTSRFKSQFSPDEKTSILAISRIKGIGPRLFKRLLQAFRSTDGILKASKDELVKVVPEPIAKVILQRSMFWDLPSYLVNLKSRGIDFFSVLEKEYPHLLREIYDPPIVIFYKGNFKKLNFSRCIGVVGTRECTKYGREATELFVNGLVSAGFTIVSGMAFGIDRIAHEAAIKSGGTTVAVLSGRVDVPSPMSNYAIYRKIVEHGCVISEYDLDALVSPGMFPTRNRIISGLCLGTLVIEAGERSGALITAKLALEQNREVFSVPSGIFSPKGVGTNGLIKRGEAKLVQSTEDILEELGINSAQNEGREKLSKPEDPLEASIVEMVAINPSSIDEICRFVGEDIAKIHKAITNLELNGIVSKNEKQEYVVIANIKT